MRFAFGGGGLEDVDFVLKCSIFEQNFLQKSASLSPQSPKIVNNRILFCYTDKSPELCVR